MKTPFFHPAPFLLCVMLGILDAVIFPPQIAFFVSFLGGFLIGVNAREVIKVWERLV